MKRKSVSVNWIKCSSDQISTNIMNPSVFLSLSSQCYETKQFYAVNTVFAGTPFMHNHGCICVSVFFESSRSDPNPSEVFMRLNVWQSSAEIHIHSEESDNSTWITSKSLHILQVSLWK